MAAVATGDLVRSLSREESLSSRGVSLVGRSLSRREESLSLRGSCLLRGVSHCEESLIARSLSRREESLARSLSLRGVSHREEEYGCGGGRNGGQGAGDNNEVKIPKEVTGGRLVTRRAGDTTIKCEGGEGRGGLYILIHFHCFQFNQIECFCLFSTHHFQYIQIECFI